MGEEVYWFSQDAFGNELSISPFAGTSWQTARNAGITEHQTGKWIDPFTGLYYFQARWLDAGVGRFVGRDPIGFQEEYVLTHNMPTRFVDVDGAECKDPRVFTKRLEFWTSQNFWGHQWVEWPGGSAGKYEDVPEGGDSCTGYGGGHIASPDPRGGQACHKWWESRYVSTGHIHPQAPGIPYNPTGTTRGGMPCCIATCQDIYDCLKDEAQKGDPGLYVFPVATCRGWTDTILSKCCLRRGKQHKGSLNGGTEP
ncbi:MAG: hypothetical protein GHCLOJNM_01039 [bacterium]|nr:hypothetical protein [bacterium]